jgi:DNA-binding response OmpR family regulator
MGRREGLESRPLASTARIQHFALPVARRQCVVLAARGLPMTAQRKILITDDDPDLRTALAEQLALHPEFEVIQATTATQALKGAIESAPDLVLMDIGLPDMDGRDAVREMRVQGFRNPIIMLTAHDSDADTILGLESGANDYVNKPFRFAVLLARIRAQLRQNEASDDAQLHIGAYTFHPSSKHLVNARGNRLRLTEKETAILRYLYRAGQAVVTREVLLREVWGYNAQVTTHTLETHIYRLRQKIEADPANAQLLVTEAGGYKLLP